VTEQLKILVDSRRIEAFSAADADVSFLWEKGVRALRSSRAEILDPDSAFTLAYQAALQGSAAVLHAAGYRVVGRDHHHSIFAGVAALGAGDLSRAARDARDMRMERHDVVYGSEPPIEAEQLAEMQDVARRLFAAAHPWLREARPGLALTPPPAG